MSHQRDKNLIRRVRVLFFAVTVSTAFDQSRADGLLTLTTASSSAQSQTSQAQLMQQVFLKEQRRLVLEQIAMQSSGATPAEMLAWKAKNASRFAAQQQRAATIELASASKVSAINAVPPISAKASSVEKQYWANQCVLANNYSAIHNHLLQQATNSSQTVTTAQLSELDLQTEQLFLEQNSSLLKAQAQQAQALAAAQAATVQPLPNSFIIPSNASPQMAASMRSESEINMELAQLRNKYASATSAVRDAALRKWFAQNASRFTQLQRQKLNSSPVTSTAN